MATIALIRDLIIIIAGLVFMEVLIFFGILAYRVNRRLQPVIESIRISAESIHDVIVSFEKLTQPVVAGAAVIDTIFHFISSLIQRFRGKGAKENGQQ